MGILRKTVLWSLSGLILWAAVPAMAQQGASRVDAPRFFESLNDVPLMPGLYEMADESVVFDKPGGRIAETAAASESLKSDEISAFYSKTLPRMGWVRGADGAFIREGESLTMNVESRGGYSIVRFMISPR